ncbi:hypothetical protein ASPBRDRAFT_535190 [Aspergillus brasiliensis CBS 101740]|uniref:Uncharacterized protein n=1 Tax=Aspergillus brasiliensis (strain CBS 101740 / IMI 381727 / IBT 21946) TaxID=767769 RepID=A0A1L9UKS0_ASPBC|nr:hypothetical protein ASPBRDRAFT_535190 [Aspergillus brasiliensis CBS 101740]
MVYTCQVAHEDREGGGGLVIEDSARFPALERAVLGFFQLAPFRFRFPTHPMFPNHMMAPQVSLDLYGASLPTSWLLVSRSLFAGRPPRHRYVDNSG